MALSIIFGTAFEVPTEQDRTDRAANELHGNVRYYVADGRTFIGHDTEEIVHVCDRACAQTVIEEDGGRWTAASEYRAGMADTYVDLTAEKDTNGASTTNHGTVDVVSFDRGDDPYVLCAACKSELYRDDTEYLAQFGRPIMDRKILAYVSEQGTAMSETGICETCHATNPLPLPPVGLPGTDGWDGGEIHDCSDNDMLYCNVCGFDPWGRLTDDEED